MIATAGWIRTAAGLLGIILWQNLIVVWAFMISLGAEAGAIRRGDWTR